MCKTHFDSVFSKKWVKFDFWNTYLPMKIYSLFIFSIFLFGCRSNPTSSLQDPKREATLNVATFSGGQEVSICRACSTASQVHQFELQIGSTPAKLSDQEIERVFPRSAFAERMANGSSTHLLADSTMYGETGVYAEVYERPNSRNAFPRSAAIYYFVYGATEFRVAEKRPAYLQLASMRIKYYFKDRLVGTAVQTTPDVDLPSHFEPDTSFIGGLYRSLRSTINEWGASAKQAGFNESFFPSIGTYDLPADHEGARVLNGNENFPQFRQAGEGSYLVELSTIPFRPLLLSTEWPPLPDEGGILNEDSGALVSLELAWMSPLNHLMRLESTDSGEVFRFEIGPSDLAIYLNYFW